MQGRLGTTRAAGTARSGRSRRRTSKANTRTRSVLDRPVGNTGYPPSALAWQAPRRRWIRTGVHRSDLKLKSTTVRATGQVQQPPLRGVQILRRSRHRMTGHVPEFGGHDAETARHDGPKYASCPLMSSLCACERSSPPDTRIEDEGRPAGALAPSRAEATPAFTHRRLLEFLRGAEAL